VDVRTARRAADRSQLAAGQGPGVAGARRPPVLAGEEAAAGRRFGRAAASEADFHRKQPTKRELGETFQLEQERVVSLDCVVAYEGRLLQLERQSRHQAPAKSRVTVRENQAGELSVEYRGRNLGFAEVERRPAGQPPLCSVSASRGGHGTERPDQPWKADP